MRVGITGTQNGATQQQLTELRRALIVMGATEIHHGDCIGADDQAHSVAQFLGLRVVIHPPSVDTKRAWNHGDESREPKPYLVRNHDIVDETECLIALPKEAFEPKQQRGGGTWATVRYARSLDRSVLVLTPAERNS